MMKWENLSDIEESFLTQVIDYSEINDIIKDRPFAEWAPFILKN